MQLLRSMLLGLTIGMAAAPLALADDATRDAPPTDTAVGTGAERLGGQPLTGPPMAPTGVGQSPTMVTSPDPRDIERSRKQQEDKRDRSDLKQPAQTGK